MIGKPFKKRHTPWNKNLTKEDHPGIMIHSIRMSGDKNISKNTEVKLKMREAKLNKPGNNKGRHWKIKDKTNMVRPDLKGVPRTKEVREAIKQKAKIRVLEGKHNFWRGGVTPLLRAIRTLHESKEWRRNVFERDNYKCFFGCKNRKLIAHHIIFFSDILDKYKVKSVQDALNCSFLWDINNGITVCEDCHNKIHSENQINQHNRITINHTPTIIESMCHSN